MSYLDWNKLVSEGRAKAHGIPWSDEEQVILRECETEKERNKKIEELRGVTPTSTEDTEGAE